MTAPTTGPLTRIQTPILMEAASAFLVLPSQYIGTLVGTTPSVLNILYFFSHAAATTVTDFLKGQPGQTLCILGNGNTTVTHGTNIFTNTGANKVLAAGKVYRFTFFGAAWYEDE